MQPDELSQSSVQSQVDSAKNAYFDGRLLESSLLVAQEVIFIYHVDVILIFFKWESGGRCGLIVYFICCCHYIFTFLQWS